MQATHTPGPWIAREDKDAMLGEDWMIGLPNGKPDEVAVCSKRDAALIAAAPDLLAALQNIMAVRRGKVVRSRMQMASRMLQSRRRYMRRPTRVRRQCVA